jgi:hypothetical protein
MSVTKEQAQKLWDAMMTYSEATTALEKLEKIARDNGRTAAGELQEAENWMNTALTRLQIAFEVCTGFQPTETKIWTMIEVPDHHRHKDPG